MWLIETFEDETIQYSVENDFTDFPQEGTQKLIEGSRKDKVLRDGHKSKSRENDKWGQWSRKTFFDIKAH